MQIEDWYVIIIRIVLEFHFLLFVLDIAGSASILAITIDH